ALARIDRALADGSGFAKFRELVAAQGGDVSQVDDPAKLPLAPRVETLRSTRTAYVSAITADEIGIASVRLGAGREKKGDPVAHGTRACRRNLLRCLRGRLASQELEQLLPIFVSVLFGDPVRRHRGDELSSGLHLAVGDRDVAESADQLSRASHLVREEQRLERKGVAQRADGDNVRLGA